LNEWQQLSEIFDLSKEDALPDPEFNVVPWHAIKGDNVPFPGPRRAAFVNLKEDEKDEDYIWTLNFSSFSSWLYLTNRKHF